MEKLLNESISADVQLIKEKKKRSFLKKKELCILLQKTILKKINIKLVLLQISDVGRDQSTT